MRKSGRKNRRRVLACSAVLIGTLTLVPAYVRAYTLSGTSVAPTLLLEDHVLVNRASYDVCLPYSDYVLWKRSGPARGELVLLVSPDDGNPIFKRVVGIPGDRVSMRRHHLTMNGRPLVYSAVDRTAFAAVPAANGLGSVIEMESLGTQAHLVTFTPGLATSAFAEVAVPADHYFLMGDNRDPSRDSRAWGTVPRARLRGRVIWHPDRINR
jgi:signal peptidase I